jgi:hypothetical protein
MVAVDVDMSPMADLANDERIELVEADLEHGAWPFPERRFEGIVVTNYLHRPLLPLLASSLTSGGVLIYETFAEGNEQYGRPRNPDFLLREGELAEAFSNLKVIAYQHVDDGSSVRQRICAVN